MEQTSRLSIVIDATQAEANIERLRNSLKSLGQTGTTTASILSRIGATRGLSGVVSQVNQTSNSFNRFTQIVNNTNTNFTRMGDTINRTTNNFTRMGDTINRNITIINNYNRSVSSTHSALSRLQGLLAGSTFGMMGLSALKTADAMQSLDSQIKLVTKSEEEYLTVRQKVRDIADQNYADIEATTNLYQNSARALANLGKTQQEALVFTNAVSLAMRTGGKSALEQKSALYQLGQAMQSGVLNGDEFRSISENAPILLDLVAKKLNVTRGEVKELASDGKITSQVIYETLANATPMLEEMAKKMPVTMGQAFALVRNKYKEFIGDFMNNDTGLSGVIAKSLAISSLHFNTFAKVAVAGAGLAMLGFTNRILISGKAMTTLATIMKAHPIFAMASVVMAVSTANRGLEATLDDLGKSLSMVGLMIKDTVNLFSELGSTAYQIFRDITSNAQDTTQTSSQLFGGFFSDTGSGFTGLMHGTAKTFDAMATTVKTFGKLAGENIAYFVTNTWDLFKIMANNIAFVFENIVNSVVGKSVNFIIEKINSILRFSSKAWEFFGNEPIAPLEPYQSNFKIGRFNVGHITQTRTWSELFDETAKEQMDNGALSWTQSLENRANATIPNANLNNPMGEYQKPKDKDKDKKKKDSKKEEDFKNRPLALSIYRALVDEGASNNQALAIVAEVGRENNFSADLVFGTHTDPARDKKGKPITNYGMISWNGTRGKEFMKFLEQGGAIKNGKMVRSQETLQLQARFLLKEALERKDKLSHFWDNPDADPESFARELGKYLVGWAYGQNTIRGKNGGRVAFDWLKHDQRRKNHLKNTTNLVNSSGYKGGRSVQDIIQDSKQQQQSQQEIQSWFADIKQQRKDQYDEKVKKVIATFGKNSKQYQSIIKYLQDDLMRQIELDKLKHDLQTQPLEPHEKINIEWRIADLEALLNHTLTDKQKEVQQQANERNATRKITELEIALAENYLSLGNYNGSLEKLGIEKFIEKKRISLNEYLTDDEKIEYVIKLDDKYKYLEEQFIQSQKAKIAELNQLNMGIQQDGRYAKYMDDFYKKTMSKPSYERWKLNNEFSKGESDEKARYQEFQDKVNAKDDTGNYIIEDALERQRLLKEAEQNHLNEMHAMREEYAEKSRQIHMDNMSQTLQGYASTFGEMSNIIKAFGGEQSKSYRAMFAISKAFAVADIGIKMGQAMGQAWGDPSATTIWQKMANVAKVTLAQGHLMQIINAVSPKGFATGGYTGNIGTSQIAGVVHGQEYVLNAKATKRIGIGTLERLNNGDSIGSNYINHINVHVTVNSDGSSNVQADTQLGKNMGDAMVNVAMQVLHKETRQGGYLDRLYRK